MAQTGKFRIFDSAKNELIDTAPTRKIALQKAELFMKRRNTTEVFVTTSSGGGRDYFPLAAGDDFSDFEGWEDDTGREVQ